MPIGSKLPRHTRSAAVSCAAVLLIAHILGCADPQSPPPPTFSVTGEVIGSDGEPLPGGIIQFISRADPARNMSSMIKYDGTFDLVTMHGNQNLAGAIEGPCTVLVTLPIVGGDVPQTITLPEPLVIEPHENHLVVDLRKVR